MATSTLTRFTRRWLLRQAMLGHDLADTVRVGAPCLRPPPPRQRRRSRGGAYLLAGQPGTGDRSCDRLPHVRAAGE